MPNLEKLEVSCRDAAVPSSRSRIPSLPLRRLSLSCGFNNATPILLLLRCLPQLRSFRLLYYKNLTGREVRDILQALPAGLTQLGLDFCNKVTALDESDLSAPLPTGLRQLLMQQFGDSNLKGLRLMDTLFNCSGLSLLVLDFCCDDLLPALLSRLPRLRCLHLTNCSRLTRQAWASLRTQQVVATTAELQNFHAEKCSESSLTDEAVADLCASPAVRGLRRLFLSDCSRLTAACLPSIASGCPQLTHLALHIHDEARESPFPVHRPGATGYKQHPISGSDFQAFCAGFDHPVRVENWFRPTFFVL
ncbi:hypothetical protein BOX15_Mlig030928g10 [Macrostomum lignano]|uniref:F-box domain-containing protein n=2 Tax=Macrostomum lignano TaxID=282301 RepID=A0A267DR22_9PLAT|nr:hypothetical protein BOX15_Mlig030928g10 [Macrostomum lignano]